jgi:hypothetical protein
MLQASRDRFETVNAQTRRKTSQDPVPEDKASQQDREPREICKTSIPGSNPGGASNPKSVNTVTCGNRCFERSRGFETVRDSFHEQSLFDGFDGAAVRGVHDVCIDPERRRDAGVSELLLRDLSRLCLAKSRNEDRTLHFEASSAGVSPRLHSTGALKIADIGSNSRHRRRLERTGGTVGWSGDRRCTTATRRRGRNGDADRRLPERQRCDRLTAV